MKPDFQALVECMERMTAIMGREFGRMPSKPLLGGRFGAAGFRLGSHAFMDGGLHDVRYFVVSDGGLFFGMGQTKPEAMCMARTVLDGLGTRADGVLAEHRAKQESARLELERKRRLEDEEIASLRKQSGKVRSIPRRRKQIFDEAEGKCHYCATPLTLDGKWHIEHKHPRALGGDNHPGNLVASCVPCNMKKRDTTDLEFKARIASERAA